ncbi:unnamed protein product [Spirodela intermedia]|uniref:Uncharacterized protein n=1 Tax=Spirodela intermedia TaxID=51605 RepID=A0A7I8IY26_SPIIN|nr:unnamed protein product [Spirodela intermedia]CAA6662767.1 unnamed protein product [Spirodela intermedia]
MVQSFMESGPNERPAPPPRCGRRRCNCFNGNCDDLSDDDLDFGDIFPSTASSHGDAVELLKSLVPCASMAERNLLADASKIMEKSSNRACCGGRGTRGGGDCRKIVADGLATLGHDASICLSRWDKSPSFPAGEYEYLDVIVNGGGERLIVDLDFRSEFEIARSTKSYRAALQALPMIFVGREDRLVEIIAVMSEAARQSLKKKGLHVPPWRKPEYMRAKWLSPSRRLYPPPPPPPPPPSVQTSGGGGDDSGDGRRGDQSVQPPPPPSPASSSCDARNPASPSRPRHPLRRRPRRWRRSPRRLRRDVCRRSTPSRRRPPSERRSLGGHRPCLHSLRPPPLLTFLSFPLLEIIFSLEVLSFSLPQSEAEKSPL